MTHEEKPFRYLTQESFLAMKPEDRAVYLKRVTNYLVDRVALLSAPQKPKKKS